MPEYYPTIGDAIGAAMAHNIRLAHRGPDLQPTPANGDDDGDEPLQVRVTPGAEAAPDSVPGTITRLTSPAEPNRAVQNGTDVEIWYEHWVCAQTRPDTAPTALEILSGHGFSVEHPWLGADCRILPDDSTSWDDIKAHATRVAEALTRAGFTTSLHPDLQPEALAADHPRHLSREQAATRTSPTARAHPPTSSGTTPIPPPPSATTTHHCAR